MATAAEFKTALEAALDTPGDWYLGPDNLVHHKGVGIRLNPNIHIDRQVPVFLEDGEEPVVYIDQALAEARLGSFYTTLIAEQEAARTAKRLTEQDKVTTFLRDFRDFSVSKVEEREAGLEVLGR